MKKSNQPSFEDNFKRLEEVVALLDAGKLPLDEMLALYEEGIKLAQACEAMLDKAELQVSQLHPGKDEDAQADSPQLF